VIGLDGLESLDGYVSYRNELQFDLLWSLAKENPDLDCLQANHMWISSSTNKHFDLFSF